MATTVMSGVFDRARWNGLYRCYRKWQRARQQMQDEQVSAEVRQTANATFYAESERWQDLLETAGGGVAMARRLSAGPLMVCAYAHVHPLSQYSAHQLLMARLHDFKLRRRTTTASSMIDEPPAYRSWRCHCEHPQHGLSAFQLADLIERDQWDFRLYGIPKNGMPRPRTLP